MRLLGTTLRLTPPLLFLGGNQPATAASRSDTVQAAERLCLAQGNAFTQSANGEAFTCTAPDDTRFSRRDLLDGKRICESTDDGTWSEVLGLWYTCALSA